VQLEIAPEPPEPVRRAIEAAVAAAEPAQESAWLRAALDESLVEDGD
jgi:hypothetical protein